MSMPDIDGTRLLHVAATIGCLQIVEHLLKYEADINCVCTSKWRKGCTPLHLAAENDSKEVVRLLLSRGANVDVSDENGRTPLHYTAFCNKYHPYDNKGEIAKLLLTKGANVDAQDKNGRTTLHLISKNGFQDIIETLLKFGADINSRDLYGLTALHIASKEGHLEVVATLLGYGSDINITSRNNLTALDHAMAKTTLYNEYKVHHNYYESDDDYDYGSDRGVCPHKLTAEALKCHIIKSNKINLSEFEEECALEIASMKSEKINNTRVSFYEPPLTYTSHFTPTKI